MRQIGLFGSRTVWIIFSSRLPFLRKQESGFFQCDFSISVFTLFHHSNIPISFPLVFGLSVAKKGKGYGL